MPHKRIAVLHPKRQESHAVARKPRDAAAVLSGLKFADKFKNSQASKARLQSPKHTSAKQNLMQNGHSRYLRSRHVFWRQLKGDKGHK